MIDSILELDERMKIKVIKMIDKLEKINLPVKIIETRRQLAVQMAYYSRGRMLIEDVKAMFKAAGLWDISNNEATTKTTNTLNSKHILGLAIDIAPVKNGKIWWDAPKEIWEQIGTIGKSEGLEWGGDWGKTQTKLGWDCPHFELKL